MSEQPEGFKLDISGQPLIVECVMCGWYSEGNRADSPRFLHSLKVHAWNFCPPRKLDAIE